MWVYFLGLPFLNFAPCRLLHADNLVTVEDVQRVKCSLDLLSSLSALGRTCVYPVDLGKGREGKGRGGITYLAHRVNGCLAKLVGEVIPLDEADSMLTLGSPALDSRVSDRRKHPRVTYGYGALHLDSTLDHPVDNSFGLLSLSIVVEQNCCAGGLAHVHETM